MLGITILQNEKERKLLPSLHSCGISHNFCDDSYPPQKSSSLMQSSRRTTPKRKRIEFGIAIPSTGSTKIMNDARGIKYY